VQLFQKVPTLQSLAPTQAEWPFALAHLLILAAFLTAGIASLRRSRPTAASPPAVG
jgi:hypothetical protein